MSEFKSSLGYIIKPYIKIKKKSSSIFVCTISPNKPGIV